MFLLSLDSRNEIFVEFTIPMAMIGIEQSHVASDLVLSDRCFVFEHANAERGHLSSTNKWRKKDYRVNDLVKSAFIRYESDNTIIRCHTFQYH